MGRMLRWALTLILSVGGGILLAIAGMDWVVVVGVWAIVLSAHLVPAAR